MSFFPSSSSSRWCWLVYMLRYSVELNRVLIFWAWAFLCFRLFCSTALTSTKWVWSTVLSYFCTVHFALSSARCQLTRQHKRYFFLGKNLRSRDLNPGWLDGKREHYLCAMPTSLIVANFTFNVFYAGVFFDYEKLRFVEAVASR